jgi:hypothetical protein
MENPRPFIPIITLADRRRRDSDDRLGGRCRGDLAFPLTVAALSWTLRMTPSMSSISSAKSNAHLPPAHQSLDAAAGLARTPSPASLASPHRMIEKKSKFHRFLDTGVNDPDVFVNAELPYMYVYAFVKLKLKQTKSYSINSSLCFLKTSLGWIKQPSRLVEIKPTLRPWTTYSKKYRARGNVSEQI